MELEELQQQAAEFLAQDKYDSAVCLYEECIEAAPNEMSSYWLLGLALLLADKELEAISVWLQAMVERNSSLEEALTADLIKVLEAEALKRLESGKYEQAEKIYWQIIEQNPNHAEAYKNLGNALFNQGKLEEAQACYKQVLILDPNYDIAYYHLGYAFHQQGLFEEAIAYYQQYLTLNPRDSTAYYNMGIVFHKQSRFEEAIASYEQALTLNPNSYEASNNLGAALEMQGKVDEAISCYQKFLTLKPNDARAYYNLGRAFQSQGKVDEAIPYYQQALSLDSNQPIAHNNLGYALQSQGFLEEAQSCYQQAFKLDSNYAKAHYNFGVLLMEKGNFSEAIACFNRAIEINPDYADAHWNRGLILLLWGEYERGFAEYEWRWLREQTPRRSFTQPLWSGEELQGRTILLYAEQGFGDTIQFIRYAPIVQQRGGIVVVECQQALVRLLTTVAGINKIVAYGTILPEFDVHAPLLSLPYILGTTLETVPAQIPYLHHDQFDSFKIEDNSRLKVGLVWSGNPEYPENYKRSFSLNHFKDILNTPGIDFYSLQKGPQVAELKQLSELEKVPLQDLSSILHDFACTAAVIAQLDLIITVDTAVAHLAGALGRPVWVLLAFNPEWRWLLKRSDSAWYPSMRLFRQQQPGDWPEVLARILIALQELVSGVS